jgi:hypothetical protein
MTTETLYDYVNKRLLFSKSTIFVHHGETQWILTEDAVPRLCANHTLPNFGSDTFSNISKDGNILNGMVAFYCNSLHAGQPLIADAIITNDNVQTPPDLKRIIWDEDGWFLFNQKTGILSDQWWHIYGYLPSK